MYGNLHVARSTAIIQQKDFPYSNHQIEFFLDFLVCGMYKHQAVRISLYERRAPGLLNLILFAM